VVPPHAAGAAHQSRAATGPRGQPGEVAFSVSSASGPPPESWNGRIKGHWRIESGGHYVRDAAFAEDASRIRKNRDIAARLRSFAHDPPGPAPEKFRIID
jgi:hypothetical protein